MTLRLINCRNYKNQAARIITDASYLKRSSDVLRELKWMNLEEMKQRQKAILMFNILKGTHISV